MEKLEELEKRIGVLESGLPHILKLTEDILKVGGENNKALVELWGLLNTFLQKEGN